MPLQPFPDQRAAEFGTLIPEPVAQCEAMKMAIKLYLDFLNLFLMLMQLLGNRR